MGINNNNNNNNNFNFSGATFRKANHPTWHLVVPPQALSHFVRLRRGLRQATR